MASAGPADEPRELLAAPWYARTRVHEYGGRSYLPVPSADEPGRFDLVFANFADQRLYRLPGPGRGRAKPTPLTPDGGRVPVRRPDPVPRRPGDLVRAGDGPPGRRPARGRVPRRRRHEGEPRDRRGPARRLRRGGRRRPSGFSSPGRTSSRSPPRRRTAPSWRGSTGTIRGCPGTAPSCASAPCRGRRRRPGRRFGADHGRPRGVGAGTALARRRVPVRDLRRIRLVEPVRGGRRGRGHAPAAAPGRGGVRRAALAARRPAVRAAVGRKAGGAARPRRAAAGGARPGDGDAGRHSPARLPDRPPRARRLRHHDRQRGRRPGRPVGGAAGRVRAAAGAADSCFEIMSEQSVAGPDPGLPAGRAAGAAFGRGGRTRDSRPRLPARQPARGGAGRRAAAVRRVHPRRPHLQRAAGA